MSCTWNADSVLLHPTQIVPYRTRLMKTDNKTFASLYSFPFWQHGGFLYSKGLDVMGAGRYSSPLC